MRLFCAYTDTCTGQKTFPKGGRCRINQTEPIDLAARAADAAEEPEAANEAPAGGVFTPPVSRGELVRRLTAYLDACREAPADERQKHGAKIPNVAGFCRFCGTGVEEFDALRERYPELHGALCAILEDEALNSDLSASVLSIYLKMRLGYAEAKPAGGSGSADFTPGGQLKIVFDHDGYADGE